MRFLGKSPSLAKILAKLKVVYGDVSGVDSLMRKLYRMEQSPKESVSAFSTRLEGVLNEISERHPQQVDDAEEMLKGRLYHGLKKPMRDALTFLFKDPKTSYVDLLVEARAMEGDVNAVHEKTVTSKMVRPAEDSGDEEAEEERSAVQQLVHEVAQLRSAMAEMKTDKTDKKHSYKPPSSGPRSGPPGRRFDKSERQCYRCHGFGHIQYDCPNLPAGNGAMGPGKGGDQPQNKNLKSPQENQSHHSQRQQ